MHIFNDIFLVKLVTEHKEQMAQLFASAKQHLEGELNDAHAKLATAMGQKDELFVALNDFSRKLDHFKRELEKVIRYIKFTLYSG